MTAAQAPPPVDATRAAETRRRRRKAAALAAILAVLAAIVAFLVIRSLTGDPPGILKPELPQYSFSIYGTAAPMGVAVSPSGDRVYVTETAGRRLVRVYDRSGEQIDTLRPPASTGTWQLPVYVAVDPRSGDVYVSDRLRRAVHVYDPSGEHRLALRPSGRLGKGASPLGLAFGPAGELYATDVSGRATAHRVLVLAGDGVEPVGALGSRAGLSFPNGLAVDGRGAVYVADSNNGRLAIFDAAGKLSAAIPRGVAAGDLALPRGVAIDGDDRLYVVDTTSHAVKVYRLDDEAEGGVPEYIGSFGSEGVEDGTFEYPNGVATDDRGRVYVTDRENGRVQVWSY